MNALDIVLLVFLVLGAYRGFKKGLFTEIIGLLAFILAIVGSFKLLHVGLTFLENQFGSFGRIGPYIAFVLIFIAVLGLVNFIGRFVKKAMDLTLLGSLDNFAGAALGVLKWAIVVSIFIWLTNTVGFLLPEETRQSSFFYPILEPLGPKVIDLVSVLIPYGKDLIASIKEMLHGKPV